MHELLRRKCNLRFVVSVLVITIANECCYSITSSVAKMVDLVTNTEITGSGYASAYMDICFKGYGTCDCSSPNLSYYWDFGDGESDSNQNPYHYYGGTTSGKRNVLLKVSCNNCKCSPLWSNTLIVYAVKEIRVDKIGDISNPVNNGRLSFNDELTIQATALPTSSNASNKIDWHVIAGYTDIDKTNTSSGTLPPLAEENWPSGNLWGPGTLYITIDSISFVSGQDGELNLTGTSSYINNNKNINTFYDAYGTENPNEDEDALNWFHYYKDTSACLASNIFYTTVDEMVENDVEDPESTAGYCDWDNPDYTCYISPLGNTLTGAPSPGVFSGKTMSYIDAFAYFSSHEWQHHLLNIDMWGEYGHIPEYDVDYDGETAKGDGLHTGWEMASTEEDGGPYDPYVYDTFDEDDHENDNERWTQMTQSDWEIGSADDEDWAHPGKNWSE